MASTDQASDGGGVTHTPLVIDGPGAGYRGLGSGPVNEARRSARWLREQMVKAAISGLRAARYCDRAGVSLRDCSTEAGEECVRRYLSLPREHGALPSAPRMTRNTNRSADG
jgi:hypothetical protein